MIRPLRAEIQTRVVLHVSHDDPLPIRLVDGQVLDKDQDRDVAPHVLRCLPGVLVPQLRLELLQAVLQHKVVSLFIVLVPVLELGFVPPLFAELLIHGSLIVNDVDHRVVYHAQGDLIGCLNRVRSRSAQIRSGWPGRQYQRWVLQVRNDLGKL